METNFKIQMDKMLRSIAQELDISEEKYKLAVNSYEAVGTYINNNSSDYNVRIFSQGSFKLGTVIKPLNDEEDYDIDLVCIADKEFTDPEKLKNSIGNILKESKLYSKMLEKENGDYKEGKRCWTIIYSDSAQYHMDILPSMKSDTYSINKKLKITNKDEITGEYTFMNSNPESYYEWFNSKMKEEKQKLLFEAAKAKMIEIEKVPEYEVKTTLQVAIQILKRYRDIKFKEDMENKPISIILTTIMASLYTGETNVYELISIFADKYSLVFEKDKDGNDAIWNPVDRTENFADKWVIYPERKKAFVEFIKNLKLDLINNTLFTTGKLLEQAEMYKLLFGKSVVEKVYANQAEKIKILEEKGQLYVSNNGKLNTESIGKKVKEHNFYGA